MQHEARATCRLLSTHKCFRTPTYPVSCLLQDCEPLTLRSSPQTSFQFVGVQQVAKGNVDANSALLAPHEAGSDSAQQMTPAQLANAARLQARSCIVRYYDGLLRSDDELTAVETRNVSLRMHGDAKVGTLLPQVGSTAVMSRVISEAQLYTQLAHFRRLLDADAAVQKMPAGEARALAEQRLQPIKQTLAAGVAAIEQLQCQSAYRYVSLANLYNNRTVAA